METLRSWAGALVVAGSSKTGILWPFVEAPWGGRSWPGEWGAIRGLTLKERGAKTRRCTQNKEQSSTQIQVGILSFYCPEWTACLYVYTKQGSFSHAGTFPGMFLRFPCSVLFVSNNRFLGNPILNTVTLLGRTEGTLVGSPLSHASGLIWLVLSLQISSNFPWFFLARVDLFYPEHWTSVFFERQHSPSPTLSWVKTLGGTCGGDVPGGTSSSALSSICSPMSCSASDRSPAGCTSSLLSSSGSGGSTRSQRSCRGAAAGEHRARWKSVGRHNDDQGSYASVHIRARSVAELGGRY